MEYIYFARPDSNIAGVNVHAARKNMGKRLAAEAPIEADVVTGVPDSVFQLRLAMRRRQVFHMS